MGQPLAVTVTVTSGQLSCDLSCQIGLTAGEWAPDLDLELRDPSGTIVADSQCALSGVSCATGHQETIGLRPSVAGTYTLRVYAWTGGTGAGGSFAVDVSRGPLAGTTSEPPPPGTNKAPVANAGADRTIRVNKRTKKASFTLDGSGSADPDGTITSWSWRLGATVVGGTARVSQTQPVGSYTYTLVVTDDGGATDDDTVVVTVRN